MHVIICHNLPRLALSFARRISITLHGFPGYRSGTHSVDISTSITWVSRLVGYRVDATLQPFVHQVGIIVDHSHRHAVRAVVHAVQPQRAGCDAEMSILFALTVKYLRKNVSFSLNPTGKVKSGDIRGCYYYGPMA